MSAKRIINENLKINTKTSSIFSTSNSKFFTLTSKNNSNINPLQISSKNILTNHPKNEKRKIIFNPSKIPKIKFSSPSLRLNYNANSLSPIKVNEIQSQDLVKENKILREQIQRLLIENKVLKQENKTYRELYQSSSNMNTLRNSSIKDTERINLKKKKTQKFFSEQFGSQFQLGFFSNKKQQRSGSIIVKDPNYNSTNNINSSLSNNNTIESTNVNHRNTVNSFLIKESKSTNINIKKTHSDKGEIKVINNNTNGDKDLNSLSSFQVYNGTNVTINSSTTNRIEEDYETNYKNTLNRAKSVLEKYNALINNILESSK